ncbi:MAG: NifB/NifX family molybdenum-iron cluster-binding protein [Armatimonadota bacterium]
MSLTVAFSTMDGENIFADDHAGMATYFDLYNISPDGASFVERHENSKFAGDESMRHGDPKKAKKSLSALEGADVWASRRFGPNLPRLLKKMSCVVVRTDTIENGIQLIQDNYDEVLQEHNKGADRSHMVLKPE